LLLRPPSPNDAVRGVGAATFYTGGGG